MTKDLVTSSCEACRADAPVLEDNEIQELLSQIPSWKVFEEGDIKKIICSFIFSVEIVCANARAPEPVWPGAWGIEPQTRRRILLNGDRVCVCVYGWMNINMRISGAAMQASQLLVVRVC